MAAARQTRLNLRLGGNRPQRRRPHLHSYGPQEAGPSGSGFRRPPITEKTFSWDTTAFSLQGAIRVKLLARAIDRPTTMLSHVIERATFIVDHAGHTKVTPRKSGATINFKDEVTRVVKADYAARRRALGPHLSRRRLFDTTRETITISLPDLKPGTLTHGPLGGFGRQSWHGGCARSVAK